MPFSPSFAGKGEREMLDPAIGCVGMIQNCVNKKFRVDIRKHFSTEKVVKP